VRGWYSTVGSSSVNSVQPCSSELLLIGDRRNTEHLHSIGILIYCEKIISKLYHGLVPYRGVSRREGTIPRQVCKFLETLKMEVKTHHRNHQKFLGRTHPSSLWRGHSSPHSASLECDRFLAHAAGLDPDHATGAVIMRGSSVTSIDDRRMTC